MVGTYLSCPVVLEVALVIAYSVVRRSREMSTEHSPAQRLWDREAGYNKSQESVVFEIRRNGSGGVLIQEARRVVIVGHAARVWRIETCKPKRFFVCVHRCCQVE